MAQKFVDLSSAVTTDRIGLVNNAAIQLSDATLIMIDYDGTSFYLKYSVDHATLNAIATLASPFTTTGSAGEILWVTLCRDNLDNLYVIGASATAGNFVVQAYVKGVGPNWTAQTALNVRMTDTGPNSDFAAVWCNTGGGTNFAGHLLVTAYNDDALTSVTAAFAICDAGVALAGAGTLVTQSGRGPTFLQGYQFSSVSGLELSPDGFGASTGLAASPFIFFSYATYIGAWGISPAGLLTTNTSVNSESTTSLVGTKVRLIRYAPNSWVLVFPSSTSAGRYMIARYSSTARVTVGTDSGAPANMPLNSAGLGWDAFLDPLTVNKIWVIAIAPQAGGNQQVYRQGCAVGAGVVWDAAATADDLLTNCFATQSDIRAVRDPIGGYADWQAFVQTAAGNYALDGDYTAFSLAPAAPTLQGPVNGSTLDATIGITATATYNSLDGANQNAYALRAKIGAAAYGYWRASDSSWQGTIQWNPIVTGPGALFSINLTSLVANGNDVNWSMASQEASTNAQGPFAADNTFHAQAAAGLTVTGPSGTTPLAFPTVFWTTSPPPGAIQINYRVIIYSQAQYTGGGFTPGTTAGVWDTGVVSSIAQQVQVGSPLVNTGIYRAYVQINVTGPAPSLWTYSDFTVSFDSPAQPTIQAVFDTILHRAALTVQGRDNMLTGDQASFEASITGWAAGANTAIAQSATFAKDGSFSLRLTNSSGATNDISAITPTGNAGKPVQPSTPCVILSSYRAGTTLRSCTLKVFWYQASGAASGVRASDSVSGNDAVGNFNTQLALTVTSPSDAAFAAIQVIATAALTTEQHYVDCVSIAPGTSTVWTAGGNVGITTVLIQSSADSGVTWYATRNNAAIPLPASTQIVVAYDYEARPGIVEQYRAITQVTLLQTPLASAPSASASVSTGAANWFLKDPADPTANLVIDVESGSFDSEVKEPNTVYYPLGREFPVVVSDTIHGEDGKIVLNAYTQPSFATLLELCKRQRVLLLESPFNQRWYIRVVQPRLIKHPFSGTPPIDRVYQIELNYVEVDQPV